MLAALLAAPSIAHADDAAAPAPAPSAPPSGGPAIELTTLRVLHEKGILGDADYASAMKDLNDSLGQRSPNATTLAVGKWSTTVYGFVEMDAIHDSTQSFTEVAGGTSIARNYSNTQLGLSNYAAANGQTVFSVRNSRLGFRLGGAPLGDVHTSAVIEMDLLGAQTAASYSTFPSPTMRLRHAYAKVETPIVDVLFGQTWALFGWQNVYHPNTVEIQGVPGELYSRVPQVRISKTVASSAVTFEVAVAALRPPSPASQIPEGQGGIRLAVNPWTGMTTNGATGTNLQPLSIAVTGDYRHFEVPNVPFDGPLDASGNPTPNPLPNGSSHVDSAAVAIDAFVPVIPATKSSRGNSLSLNGELVTGYGMADLYSNLTGGVTFPNVPLAGLQGINYPANINNGLVVLDNVNFNLHPIQWTSYLVGVQYYLPGLDGRAWISGNYSHMESGNTKYYALYATTANQLVSNYALASTVRASESWYDVNLFADVAPGVRVGAEYAYFSDKYVDGFTAPNTRFQVSGWYIF
jgi:hypothetical protein